MNTNALVYAKSSGSTRSGMCSISSSNLNSESEMQQIVQAACTRAQAHSTMQGTALSTSTASRDFPSPNFFLLLLLCARYCVRCVRARPRVQFSSSSHGCRMGLAEAKNSWAVSILDIGKHVQDEPCQYFPTIIQSMLEALTEIGHGKMTVWTLMSAPAFTNCRCRRCR